MVPPLSNTVYHSKAETPTQPGMKESPQHLLRRRMKSVGALSLVLLLGLIYVFDITFSLSIGWKTTRLRNGPLGSLLQPTTPHQSPEKEFHWQEVTPSEKLVWVPCWEKFECARLKVPLDWTDPNGTAGSAAIAMVKVPAAVPETSDSWDGPVLINPGGPGGSGVRLARGSGEELQTIIGRNHSIIGFDPRGVGSTTPATTCFAAEVNRRSWKFRNNNRALGTTEGWEEVSEGYAGAKALGSSCQAMIAEAGSGAEYVNTASVARDMLAITEAAWDAAGKVGVEHGLKYWGFSYGTILGMTFSSMYPSRVDRVVVDGVVDIDDYYTASWKKNLLDSDKVLESFFTYCSIAGPEACPFHAGNSSSSVASRLDTLLERMRQAPVPLVHKDDFPDVVTYSDVLQLIWYTLYTPMTRFPDMAQALVDLEAGNGSTVAHILGSYDARSNDCKAPDPYPLPNTGEEATHAILCSDGVPQTNMTVHEFKEYVDTLMDQSWALAGHWARIRLACTGYPIRPKGLVYNGPWGANTSTPLFFLQSTIDPVTPLVNARTMRKLFNGSGLLVQESEGHCSFSGPSICTANAVRKYFSTGEVPAVDEMACQVNERPFGLAGPEVKPEQDDDAELLEALKVLREKYFS